MGNSLVGTAMLVLLSSGFTVAAGAPAAFAHTDGAIEIRSTVASGGALAATGIPDEPIAAPLVFCSNGECLYVSEEGAILTPDVDDATEGLFALTAGTAVRLVVVSIDPGASLKIGGAKLDQAGESTNLGKAPLHVHPFWQIDAPDGETGEWRIAFRFTTGATAYANSADYEVVVTNHEHGTSTTTSTSTTTIDRATCGDGTVDVGEDCDAGQEAWSHGRACNDDCQWVACGDPDGDGKTLASDALFVLSAAVGTQTCNACVCNVDASAPPAVSGVDALRILRYAVGIDASALSCPACRVSKR